VASLTLDASVSDGVEGFGVRSAITTSPADPAAARAGPSWAFPARLPRPTHPE
jgi:hypothetical protein